MARIRSIKPEFWDDRKLGRRVSRDARLLYIALWNLADEHGRLNGDPQWLKGQVFAYDDDIDAAAVMKLLAELQAPGVDTVVAYEADGDPYLHLPKLARHQRLEPDKVKSRLPAPPDRPGPPRPPAPPDPETPCADSPEPRADQPERDANSSALLYVAGSREHGAGSRGVARGRVRDAPTVPHELPEDFAITGAMRRWAHATHPGLDLDYETSQFCHHYRSTGQKRKSWAEAWQKWIEASHKRGQSRASPRRDSHQPTHDDFNALRQNWARPLDEQEAGIDSRGNDKPDGIHRHSLPGAENREGISGRVV